MSIKRIAIALAAATGAVLLAASPAFAGNAHFIDHHTGASLNGTSLVVSFKEAGLESGSVETVTATAHLMAVYQCINNGGSNPADPKKTTVDAEVSQSGEFTANKNGQLVGSLTLSTPDAASVLDCPNGQKAMLTAGTWSSVEIMDETSGAWAAVDGSFSFGAPVGHGRK
ncbi:hypothetical protein JNB62_08960 [Microbacterium jejuense]|uniref:Uncharacterized protein n=1 Tax=Microbacterium jejuense TaxID=1263637 RepID=A0ABS7HN08_9MICO|nr:hypothetical protein [Microbacterium jejuense]MBW9093810.1 hypothetical protein [Microbacterium jejuense]